jgi:hypothetical protein
MADVAMIKNRGCTSLFSARYETRLNRNFLASSYVVFAMVVPEFSLPTVVSSSGLLPEVENS